MPAKSIDESDSANTPEPEGGDDVDPSEEGGDDEVADDDDEAAEVDAETERLNALLEAHREFILQVDDKSRIGYSMLGIFTMVSMVLAVVLTGTPLFSIGGVALFLGGGLVAVILGRIVGLGRQDRLLRARVRTYCEDTRVSLADLLRAALLSGRFVYFIKLFYRSQGPAPNSNGAERSTQ